MRGARRKSALGFGMSSLNLLGKCSAWRDAKTIPMESMDFTATMTADGTYSEVPVTPGGEFVKYEADFTFAITTHYAWSRIHRNSQNDIQSGMNDWEMQIVQQCCCPCRNSFMLEPPYPENQDGTSTFHDKTTYLSQPPNERTFVNGRYYEVDFGAGNVIPRCKLADPVTLANMPQWNVLFNLWYPDVFFVNRANLFVDTLVSSVDGGIGNDETPNIPTQGTFPLDSCTGGAATITLTLTAGGTLVSGGNTCNLTSNCTETITITYS